MDTEKSPPDDERPVPSPPASSAPEESRAPADDEAPSAEFADALARQFLFAMINEKDRSQVEILIKGQRVEIAGEPGSNE